MCILPFRVCVLYMSICRPIWCTGFTGGMRQVHRPVFCVHTRTVVWCCPAVPLPLSDFRVYRISLKQLDDVSKLYSQLLDSALM